MDMSVKALDEIYPIVRKDDPGFVLMDILYA